jgi:hypothetical protein
MTAAFNNLMIVGTTAIALLVSANASAAVSIGVPKGRPYFGAPSQSGGQSFRSYTPSYSPSTEARQSFSYEPAEKAAPVKSNPCQPQATVAPKTEKQDVARAPQRVRRSYSYEPETRSNVRSNAGRSGPRFGGKSPWMYQKTDPRRNQ